MTQPTTSTEPHALIVKPSPDAIKTAAELLGSGQLVALPTETVYGLGADACNNDAVKGIYDAKGRPSHNPLICHVTGKEMAAAYVNIPPLAEKLMDHFWPGPFTIVLKRKNSPLAERVTAGLETLAVRCPGQADTLAVITALGRPIAAPSANPSGKLSPTAAEHVAEGLGHKVALILDGGPSPVGIESTIVSVKGDHVTVLRPGSITSDQILAVTGAVPIQRNAQSQINAPGQLSSHYAPNAAVRLNVTHHKSGEVMIGFGSVEGDFNLSANGDLDEAAEKLFATMRLADEKAAGGTIAIAPIPEHGVGIAINDRLIRAAAPRDP